MKSDQPLLIGVVGPTAIGKTKMAIALAQALKTEIISADSRQVYREMTIGTAVPTAAELAAAPHHFIQHQSITDNYTVGDYEREALDRLAKLFQTHPTVIMVGGSGLHVYAVLNGLDDFPEVPEDLRQSLNQAYEEKGINWLQEELQQADPEYFDRVDIHNPHRLLRALGVSKAAGKPYSSFLGQAKPQRPFRSFLVGLHAERELIYDRINQRVDQMMEQGLLEEARGLFQHRTLNALQTVGYSELFRHFEGKITLEEAVSEIKKNTRRFAKRQLTWFNKNQDIHWFDYKTPASVVLDSIKKGT